MAIANAARADNERLPVGALFAEVVTFDTTGSYATGGYATFSSTLEAVIGKGRTILGVLPLECQGYIPEYDADNDKLKLLYGNYDASDGPLIEVAAGALALTGLKVLVLAK